MTSGQKTAVSLLAAVVLFAGFMVAAFAGLFSVIETRFYQPVKITEIRTQLNSVADCFDGYTHTLTSRFSTYAGDPVIATYLQQKPADEDVRARTKITGSLFANTQGLIGIRLLDSNGRSIHFSTFSTDIQRSSENLKSYKNYDETVTLSGSTELPVASIVATDSRDGSQIKYHYTYDGADGRIIFSLPFYDSYTAYRGTMLFYVNANDFNRELVTKNIVSIGNTGTLVSDQKTAGFVFGLPSVGRDMLIQQLFQKWQSNAPGPEKLASVLEGDYWIYVSSTKSSLGIITGIYRSDVFLMPSQVRAVLLICVFVSLFLVIFLIMNLKHDDMLVIRDRIRRFQFALVKEYLDKREDVDWTAVSRQIAGRKEDVSNEIRKSLGRRGRKHSVEVNTLLDKSWEEILSAFNIKSGNAIPETTAETAEIKKMLEEILSSGSIKVQAIAAPSDEKETVKKVAAVRRPAVVKAERVVQKGSAEEVAEAEPVDAVSEAEPIEEIAEAEPAEVIPEAQPAEEVSEAESVEEVAEAEPAEEISEAEPVDAVSEAEPIEEVAEAEPAEVIPEAQPAEEVSEAEPAEEISEAEPVDTVSEAEPIEEVAKTEPVDAVSEAEPIEEIQEAEHAEAVSETEPVKTAPDTEPVEEITDINEIEDVSDIEPAKPAVADPAEKADINFVISAPDFSFLDKLSQQTVQSGAAAVSEMIPVEPTEEVPEPEPEPKYEEPVENIEEIEPLDTAAERERFNFTVFGANNNNVTDLAPDTDAAIVTGKDGLIRIPVKINTGNIHLDPEFKKLVDSVIK